MKVSQVLVNEVHRITVEHNMYQMLLEVLTFADPNLPDSLCPRNFRTNARSAGDR